MQLGIGMSLSNLIYQFSGGGREGFDSVLHDSLWTKKTEDNQIDNDTDIES